MDFYIEVNDGLNNTFLTNSIVSKWLDVTPASRTSEFSIRE